ncbi:MAG: lysophospholipid acyltransferase family protein [Puniceicoccaceae bacterium]
MPRSTSTSLWRPANVLAALGILILKLSAKLPFSWMRGLGKGIGSVAGILFPYRQKVGLVNLRLCFPEMSEKERRQLLFRHYQSMGMGIFEMAAGWYKPEGYFEKISRVTGLEHLKAVEESGRGALLLTAHFTTLEFGGRMMVEHYKAFSCLYRKPNQPVIAREMTRIRETKMRHVIHFDEMNDLIRALRDGEFVWYAPDQGKKMKYSDIIPFFGEPAVTNTATGRIARMGKAAILPFVGYRCPDGHYQLDIYPELTHLPTKDAKADALEINHLIEELVRKAPDQYFWLHKRFKRRGPGYPDVYES